MLFLYKEEDVTWKVKVTEASEKSIKHALY